MAFMQQQISCVTVIAIPYSYDVECPTVVCSWLIFQLLDIAAYFLKEYVDIVP